jgi:beta-N-acetylhexosaminidase
MRAAFITGLAGLELMPEEAAFLARVQPAGLILFARNCDTPDQLRALIADARGAIGAGDVLVLIDQEGGRVQRLRPPHWRALPPASNYANLAARDPERAMRAARLAAQLTAQDLLALGINTNCAPVLDVPVPGSHDIIGNRAYGKTPDDIIRLGRVVAEGYLSGGVLPVIKHIPGHGRATADSHLELPVVATSRADLEATDFVPFRALRDIPAAMTAHVVFTSIDPAAPASTSAIVHRDILRGSIGYDGLLMSDDLGMKALTGRFEDRAAAVIGAGSDVALHCNGNLEEMIAVAAGVPALAADALRRFQRAVAVIGQHQPFVMAEAEACLGEVLRLTG